MKKGFKYFLIVWIVGFVLFNAVTFLIPNEVFGVTRLDKPVFWIAYALIVLSLVALLISAHVFVKDDSAKKTFLRIPLLTTGYAAVAVAIVVGLVFMIFPVLPAWVGAIVCLLVAGYFLIACIKAAAAVNIVETVEEKVTQKTAFIRIAIMDAEAIMGRAKAEEEKTAAKSVYEALRYSDPMSNSALEEIEAEIGEQLKELKQAVKEGVGVAAIADELLLLIKERNGKCKALK